MFIDITERNFNTTKEIWENNGIKTYDIPLSAADCRVEGNDAIITLRLPHEDALYTDYASIMYWIQGDDGSEREESRAGLSVPSSCTMSIPIGDDDVRSQFTSIVSGTTKGLAELRIHCENVQALAGLIAAPKAVTYLRPMWYTGYGEDNALNPDRLTPDNTVVMEDMRDALENSSLLEGRGQILNGKRYLFTFDEDEYYWNYIYREGEEPNIETFNIPMSPSFYEIIQKDGTENFTEDPNATGALRYDGKFIYTTSGCIYVKMKRMNYFHGEEVGYSSDEIEDVLNGNVTEYFDSTEALRGIINFFDTDEMININLRRNGLYLVSGTLSFEKSNICIIGHGSQIRVWNPILSNDGYYVLIGYSGRSGVKNVEICDLTFQGLMKYENGAIVNAKEQCISFGKMLFPTNMTFYEVNIDGFETGVHISNETYSDKPLDIRFIYCNVSRTMFGYNFKASKQVLVSGGSVDNSLSIDKMHHCVYVSEGSNCITVENCVLKNSTGAAIHQMSGNKTSKMVNNHYRHLTIKNCFDGIVLCGYTLDASAKHIRGEDIGRFLHLSNCGGVVVKDYFATQLKTPTIYVGEGDEKHSFTNREHYNLMAISNCVDATVENCYFDGAIPFKNGKADYTDKLYCPRFIASEYNDKPFDSASYESGWVEDGYAIAKVIFRNCRFTQKNDHEGTKADSTFDRIGFNKSCMFSWDFLFDNCEFSNFRRIFSKKRIYFVQGNDGKKSTYRFHNCKAYYGIEEPIGNNDVPDDGFYFINNGGANLFISGSYDCYTSFNVPDNIKSHNGTVVD
ncbi:MAG: hypothetical protein SOW51_05190 [Oscillospiraceae bacterium]|nr:hypothetical protein [Oscillospiraceae bacterium]